MDQRMQDNPTFTRAQEKAAASIDVGARVERRTGQRLAESQLGSI
jgi:hypothetical protein